MTQEGKSRFARFWPWAVVGLVAALLQGVLVFAWRGYGGSFVSLTGLGCVLVPLGVELVLAILAVKNLDALHGQTVTNPHSLLGQVIRNDAGRPPAPPPTREAWKGGFEDMDDASDKMSKGR